MGQTENICMDAAGSLDKYPAKQHAQLVASKLDDPDALIYLLGQYDFTIEDSDMSKTWRQRRYFYYCSGVDVPDCCLTYDAKQDELVLYIPEIKPERVLWSGRGPTIQEAKDRYDVDDVRLNGDLFGDLNTWAGDNVDSTFYILHKDHKPQPEHFSPHYIDNRSLLPAIDACRVIKDEHEIQLIRRANEKTTIAHTSVLSNIKKFVNESQIEGAFVNACIVEGAKQSYPVIAGSGENAGMLHYIKNNEPLEGRQLVCLDAGAEWKCYASDVTRTIPISGTWPSQEAKDIYGIVNLMQSACIAKMAPGVKYLDLHILAHEIAAQGLLRLGILRGASVEELVRLGTTRAFFPHGLGHHLGLEVHDVLNLPILKYEQSTCAVLDTAKSLPPCTPDNPNLEEGMVVTVEPGIYFSRYELQRIWLADPKHAKHINKEILDRYYPVGGVRIEDDILVTGQGYQNLTTTPKGEEALALIREGSAGC